ncbi:Peptidase S24/S26A/S26B/S26C family protein [Zea mays]|uniref:Signal peptidase complex catalytic subunit SEC11 n=1 Tax=Zea mays TaxID=4577 RepID=A0A1D6M1V7_MAIZE|nr:Peptidase S24/S26A/S26B/S26C family protein [Zea mays]
MGFVGDTMESIRSMQIRQVLMQIISLGDSLCRSLFFSPDCFFLLLEGDILFLHMSKDPIRTGEIVVFNVDGREIPIVHRVIKVHERQDTAEVDILTKGDNNFGDDRLLYAHGQLWLQQHHIMGRAVGYLPYVGWVTIIMTEKPFIKYLLIGALGLLVITSKD